MARPCSDHKAMAGELLCYRKTLHCGLFRIFLRDVKCLVKDVVCARGKKSKENGKCEIAEEKNKTRWIEIITVEKCCS